MPVIWKQTGLIFPDRQVFYFFRKPKNRIKSVTLLFSGRFSYSKRQMSLFYACYMEANGPNFSGSASILFLQKTKKQNKIGNFAIFWPIFVFKAANESILCLLYGSKRT